MTKLSPAEDYALCSPQQIAADLAAAYRDAGLDPAELASQSTFIGKPSPKGLVVRELQRGRLVGQWFVPAENDAAPLGWPLRMPRGGGKFERAPREEAERVLFFARRA